MNTHDQERARAIQLLHSLIERSPSDARSRSRLLSLLYANGNQGQFVFEARKYKECCDLSFDADWVWICDMGLELDPGNSLFRVSATRTAAENSDVTTSQDCPAQVDTTNQDCAAQVDTTSQDCAAQVDTTSQDCAAQVDSRDGTNRRISVERRNQDRRTAFSAWYGTENRKNPRRQKYRRQIDLEARTKR